MKIVIKLFLGFLAVSIISILLVGFLSFNNAKSALEEQTIDGLTAVADSKESEVFLLIDKLKTRTEDFSSDGFIRDALVSINAEDFSVVEELNNHLKTNKKGIDVNIIVTDVIDLKGIVRASSDETRIGIDVSQKELFFKQKTEVYVTNPSSRSTMLNNVLTMPVSASLSHKITQEKIGIIVNYFSLNQLNRLMIGELSLELGAKTSARGIGLTGETYVVNEDKLMITDSLFLENTAFNQKIDTFPVDKCFENNREVNGIWPDYRGISVLGSSHCLQIGDFNWMIVSEQDEAEAFKSIVLLRNSIIVLGLIIGLIVTLISFFIARLISKPIKVLDDAVEEVSKGNFDVKVEVTTKDEVGNLTMTFNNMVTRIKNLKRAKALQKLTDELAALEQGYKIKLISGGSYRKGKERIEDDLRILKKRLK